MLLLGVKSRKLKPPAPLILCLKYENMRDQETRISPKAGYIESTVYPAFLSLQAQDDAMIQVDRSGTHIITHENEALRINIRDSLLECVSQF